MAMEERLIPPKHGKEKSSYERNEFMATRNGIDLATLNAIQSFLKRVATRFDVSAAILFGSRARRTHRPDSDADVAVLLRGHHGAFVETKLAMADLAYDVLLESGIRIQVLPIWADEWEHPEQYSNPNLLENIKREGVRL